MIITGFANPKALVTIDGNAPSKPCKTMIILVLRPSSDTKIRKSGFELRFKPKSR